MSEDDINATSGEQSVDGDNNTEAPIPSQPKKLHVIGEEKHAYNADSVMEFIDNIFQDVPDGAHRLVYSSPSNIPGSPMSGVDMLERVLTRTTKPRALYYAMSSVYPDADGKLSHKTAQFAAMHGVIFDDVGTKIDPKDIPEGLEPTYIIESSAGNYQWGFIFDKPVTDVKHAQAIINTIAAAGLTDAGGKVPIKLVRLPEGINGKPNSEKQTFQVSLHTWSGLVYTPEQLLDRIGYDDGSGVVTWERIARDEYDPLVKKHKVNYLPLAPMGQSTDGFIDDVLEWLYKNDQVVANSGDGWVDIICPWHHEHTDGNPIAGYNPLGQGTDPYTRGFHCFHEHCKDNGTKEFLMHTINSSDMNRLAYRVSAWLPTSEYALDIADDVVMKLVNPPVAHKITALKRHYQRDSTPAVDGLGKHSSLNPVDAWLDSPYRISISGEGTGPGKPQIYTDHRGTWLNTCVLPEWGTGAFDQAHVDEFLTFCNYLIPDAEECRFWLDWLTHKMLDPTFRGTGIVMVTPTFGVGRSTMASMIEKLLGTANTARVAFSDLVNSAYNSWEDKLFVTVDEVRDTSSNSTGLHKAYEVLKQRVDTSNVMTTVNPKYGKQREVMCCTGYLILSNHINAIALPQDDRRLTVLSNAEVKESAQYFIDLHTWLKKEEWMPHVFRYLCQRTTTHDCLKPLVTSAKSEMADSTQSKGAEIAKLIETYCVDNNIHFAPVPALKWVLTEALIQSGNTMDYSDKYFTACLNDISRAFKPHKIKIDGKAITPRIMTWAVHQGVIGGYEEGMWKLGAKDMGLEVKQDITSQCKNFDQQAVLKFVLAEVT